MKTWITRLLLPLAAILATVASATSAPAQDKPDLTGKVVDSGLNPVKNATVFVYTAGPKIGTGVICPSCYPDCRKRVQTAPDGTFKIESLDPNLLFKLLVVSPGTQPKFVSKVDPAKGPQEIELIEIDDDPDRVKTKGIVINPEGQPVFGAVLNVEGAEYGPGTSWGGIERYSDPVAVTDENGLFTLRSFGKVSAVHALLETSDYAKRWVRLTPGNDHILRVQDGVIVRGEILDQNGKPLPNAIVAMATTEREAGKHLKDFEAITGRDGKFAILNVTPEHDYFLFGKMGSFGRSGALPVRNVKAGRTDTTLDLGSIKLTTAHTIKGRVILPDAQEIPPNTRLFLGRDEAWDHTETMVGPNGDFEFTGVPAETLSLSLRIAGYKLSKKNPSLDWLNGGILGRLDRDLTDFNILLERGNWRYNEEVNEAPPGVNTYPREQPLRGAKL